MNRASQILTSVSGPAARTVLTLIWWGRNYPKHTLGSMYNISSEFCTAAASSQADRIPRSDEKQMWALGVFEWVRTAPHERSFGVTDRRPPHLAALWPASVLGAGRLAWVSRCFVLLCFIGVHCSYYCPILVENEPFKRAQLRFKKRVFSIKSCEYFHV